MTTVRATLESVIASLRDSKGLDGFSHLTEFLEQFHQAFLAGKITADPKSFNPIFQEILVAQAKGEPNHLADILEFELSPLLA